MVQKIPLTREEKEKMVIDLFIKGASRREISKKARLSFTDIQQIISRYSGEESPAETSKKYSKHSQALELFEKGNSNLQVAIKLGLTFDETIQEKKQYMQLKGADKFGVFYDQMKGDLDSYVYLNEELITWNMGPKDAIEGVIYARRLNQIKLEINQCLSKKEDLERDIYLDSQILNVQKEIINNLTNQIKAFEEAKKVLFNKIKTTLETKQLPPARISKRKILGSSPEKFQEFAVAIRSEETASNKRATSLEQCLIEEADKIDGYEIIETGSE